MRCLRLLCAFTLASVCHLPTAAAPACADGTLALNEFLAAPARDWDGSGTFSSRDDEWVEVINRSAAPLDLAGFVLSDGDSIPRYAFSGTLAPGAVQLVTGRNSFDWEKATGHPAFGLSLGNTGDSVILWHVVGADTLIVDSFTYDAHDAGADRSVGRSLDGATWQLFDSLNPYTGSALPAGNGCAPTPGAVNNCVTTDTRPSTWGRLKALYR